MLELSSNKRQKCNFKSWKLQMLNGDAGHARTHNNNNNNNNDDDDDDDDDKNIPRAN